MKTLHEAAARGCNAHLLTTHATSTWAPQGATHAESPAGSSQPSCWLLAGATCLKAKTIYPLFMSAPCPFTLSRWQRPTVRRGMAAEAPPCPLPRQRLLLEEHSPPPLTNIPSLLPHVTPFFQRRRLRNTTLTPSLSGSPGSFSPRSYTIITQQRLVGKASRRLARGRELTIDSSGKGAPNQPPVCRAGRPHHTALVKAVGRPERTEDYSFQITFYSIHLQKYLVVKPSQPSP